MLWILITGGVMAFFMSAAMGANGFFVFIFLLRCTKYSYLYCKDVANSMGTIVGSKTLTIWQAMIIAAVCEFAGAMLLGGHVSSMIRNGIIKLSLFTPEENSYYMLGMLCVLIGPTIWIFIATKYGLPVSTTHSIVGGIIGFGITMKGYDSIQWNSMIKIVLSWIVSPVLGAIIAAPFYLFLHYFVQRSKHAFLLSLFAFFPCMTMLILSIVITATVYKGSSTFYFDQIPGYIAIPVSITIGILSGLILSAIIIPILWKKLKRKVYVIPDQPNVEVMEKGVKEIIEKLEDEPEKVEAKHKTNHAEHMSAESAIEMKTIEIKKGRVEGEDSDESTNEELIHHGSDDDRTHDSMDGTIKEEGTVEELQQQFLTTMPSAMNIQEDAPIMETQMETTFVNEGEDYKFTSWLNQFQVIKKYVQHTDFFNEVQKSEQVYKVLQIFCSAFTAFSHGSNDVGNAIGPFSAIYFIYMKQIGEPVDESSIPAWQLLIGAIGIVIGFSLFGYTVIKTIGNKITDLKASSALVSQFSGATLVMAASKLGIPASTTNSIVGAVFGVAVAQNPRKVPFKLLLEIVIGWLITIPVSAAITSACFSFLKWIL